jgi:hypothetical protein
VYLPDLAASLNNLSVRLGEVGRSEEALAAINEAAELRHSLTTTRDSAKNEEVEQQLARLEWMEADLPKPGDEVRVLLGLESVRGHVLELRSIPARPQIVVEIDAGQISDQPERVTVPLGAVVPTEVARTPWAVAARFEHQVAEALTRVGRGRLSRIELDARVAGQEIDIVGWTADERAILVDVKAGRKPLSPYVLKQVLDRLMRLALEIDGVGLLVSMQPIWRVDLSVDFDNARVSAMSWQGPEDDEKLAATLQRLLLAV